MKNKMESDGLEPQTIDAECQLATYWAIWDTLLSLFIKVESLFPRKNTIFLKFSKCFVGAKMYSMVRIRYVHMGLWNLPRFGVFFVLKGTAFRCFILEPVPDVPLVRLWGSIGTRIPIWVKTYDAVWKRWKAKFQETKIKKLIMTFYSLTILKILIHVHSSKYLMCFVLFHLYSFALSFYRPRQK